MKRTIYGTSGFGAAISLAAGPASIGATFEVSTVDNSGAGGSKKTSHSVLCSVEIDLGDIDPFISFDLTLRPQKPELKWQQWYGVGTYLCNGKRYNRTLEFI